MRASESSVSFIFLLLNMDLSFAYIQSQFHEKSFVG